jgi:hypothetical protein
VFRLVGSALLMGYSGVLVHFSGGLIEVHFHVFVSMAFLIVYYDWLPQEVAAVTIAAFVIAMASVSIFIAEYIRRSALAVQAALTSKAERDRGADKPPPSHATANRIELRNRARGSARPGG